TPGAPNTSRFESNAGDGKGVARILRMKTRRRREGLSSGHRDNNKSTEASTAMGYFTTVCFSNSCAIVSSRSFGRLISSHGLRCYYVRFWLVLIFEHSNRY